MVGYEYVVLVFLYILVAVDYLDRNKEYPAGEFAPDDCGSVVGILYLETVTENADDYYVVGLCRKDTLNFLYGKRFL